MKLKPPQIRNSFIIIWASITAALVIAVAGLVVAFVATRHANTADDHARVTAAQAKTTAECINAVLRTRNDLTNQDHMNEAQKIADQKVAVNDQAAGVRLILTGVPAQGQRGALLYQQGVNEFVESLARWQTRDAQINAERAKNPLGRC